MSGRLLSGVMALAGSVLMSACSVIPQAVVAVPQGPQPLPKPLTEKPLFQIERLVLARGSDARWGFVNDRPSPTVLQLRFQPGANPFEPQFGYVCMTIDAQTARRIETKPPVVPQSRDVPATGARQSDAAQPAPVPVPPRNPQTGTSPLGPQFELPAATDGGPSVCVAKLKVARDATAGDHPYTIYQDGVAKQDPVIVIR